MKISMCLSSWWQLIRTIFTSFTSIALLEDSVRHNEGIVFVAWHKYIWNLFKICIEILALFCLIVERRTVLELEVPWNLKRARMMYFLIFFDFLGLWLFSTCILAPDLMEKCFYFLSRVRLTGLMYLGGEGGTEIIFCIKNVIVITISAVLIWL